MVSDTPVVDVEFGTEQLSGNRALYIELLTQFSSQYSTGAEHLAELLGDEKMEDARAYSHTVKGVAVNMGLPVLGDASKALEHTLRDAASDKARVDELFSAFKRALARTLKAIEQLTNEEGVATHQPTASEPSPINTLMEKLTQNEFIDGKTASLLANELALDDTSKAALLAAIDSLEYPTALSILERVSPKG